MNLGALAHHTVISSHVECATLRTDLELATRVAPDSPLTIACLPIEIICYVFGYLCLCDCISVSAVCHHWREVALGCPALWSVFDTVTCNLSSVGLEETIKRSGRLALKIRVHLPTFYPSIIALLRNNMHRLHSLSLHDPWVPMGGVFQNGIAPQLEYLDVQTDFCASSFVENYRAVAAAFGRPIHFGLVKRMCPQLRHLKLTQKFAVQQYLSTEPPDDTQCPEAVALESVCVNGPRSWVGHLALHTLRISAHVYLHVSPLNWGILSHLPTMGQIEELALMTATMGSLVIAARSGTRTRSVSFDLVVTGTTAETRILSSPTWMSALESLTLYNNTWQADVPPFLPSSLRHLTIMVKYGDGTSLYKNGHIFPWPCPVLQILTIGAVHSRGPLVCLTDERLVTLVRDMLGFCPINKLERLVLVNVALIGDTDTHVIIRRNRGSALQLTETLKVVRDIELIHDDKDFNGLPSWWKDGLVPAPPFDVRS
ncbi:hypothetical protein EXIGLDRAFT_723796 [Exidia glandulosa HHB12029]|uniref:F-box domain-containing protein n=1 Tax=Exidia glandulosa HHB12029 TaxID=1314781 RepID=A0A165ENQ2_EXIGL|nr:hypothetical protein EXIGLDRAFT_723796 [Exidia glandulosa HHB12029]